MAKVISGEEDLSKAPIITLENSPTSPLAWGANAVESLIETATNGILFNVLPSPMSGTTSPITLAGTLQILNAEVLSAILIAQLARKGTPVMYGSAANITDMREANPVACTPEAAILDIACIQLGKYYNLPTNTVGADSDSHCLDEQAAWEILLTGTAAICAGANTMLNVGMISNGMQVSYEQLVIDNEILGLLFRFCNGIELSHETLATDLIKKVGPEGHFLAEANFAMRYLDKEYWTPILSCRSTYGKWAKQGRKDVVERAKENTQKILNEHKAEELPKNVENELRQIVRRFEKRVITQT
jgi:trimethylamine--corrinoid protein Co-methyltransferase